MRLKRGEKQEGGINAIILFQKAKNRGEKGIRDFLFPFPSAGGLTQRKARG